MPEFALGIDFGTNSVRALIVRCENGDEVATAVVDYPSGEQGVILDPKDPHLARQNPRDHVDSCGLVLRNCLSAASGRSDFDPSLIVGIGVDTTGSSPIPVNEQGIPLASRDEFAENPNAQCWLWKDHTAHAEAEEITQSCRRLDLPYLNKCGGTYSSEWLWAKALHCARVAPDVFDAAYSWVELQDFVPAHLTGNLNPKTMKRGVCAAGHKAMYSEEWGGLPSREFLASLDPRLGYLRDRMYDQAVSADQCAGNLCAAVAEQTGLQAGTPVAVGAFDAHLGAVGSGIRAGRLVKIMGTSTCDLMVGGPSTPDIPGVCGIISGSIIPGMPGIEAGQSAVGDLFAWCASNLGKGGPGAHEELAAQAAGYVPGQTGLLALDWNNGNRTVLVDQQLTGLIVGQTLHTSAGAIYRALIEATAFGALTIINRLEEYGVRIDDIVTGGGIAEKSPLTMQIYADVLNRRILISRSAQTCALGSAIAGSVVGGAHPSFEAAIGAMTGVKDTVFSPNPQAVDTYRRLYALYQDLHDAFGRTDRTPELHNLMKALIRIRQDVQS